MENATKALLIAAAVLIVIIIISLGVYVVGMGQAQLDQGEQALSGLEINTFNSTYENYEGTSVAGSRVNSLIKNVYQHNLTESDDTRKITIDGVVTLAADATTQPTVGTGKRYSVVCNYDKNSGLITSITITEVGSQSGGSN